MLKILDLPSNLFLENKQLISFLILDMGRLKILDLPSNLFFGSLPVKLEGLTL